MKKLLYLLICLPLIFSSCKKEDDSPNSGSNGSTNNTSASILGTWEIDTREYSGYYGYIDPILGTEIVTDSSTTITYTHNDTNRVYLVFRYDNTHTWYDYYLDTLRSETDYTYLKDGNVVSIYDSLLLVSLQLTTLTNNNLSFYWDDIWTDVWNDTTFFENSRNIIQCVKSELPSITTEPLNKKKPVSGYNSFLNRRENR